jgi:hypothetical protein
VKKVKKNNQKKSKKVKMVKKIFPQRKLEWFEPGCPVCKLNVSGLKKKIKYEGSHPLTVQRVDNLLGGPLFKAVAYFGSTL